MSPKQIALVSSFLVLWLGPIQAHDIYTDLLTRSGLPCCHDGDCRPVRYRLMPKEVQMFVDEQWLDIPRGIIQYRTFAGDRGETGEFIGAGCKTQWGTLPAVRSCRPSPSPLIRTHYSVRQAFRDIACPAPRGPSLYLAASVSSNGDPIQLLHCRPKSGRVGSF